MWRLLLICALALGAAAPTEVLAKGNPWQQKRVVVYDYSGPEWSPYVQDAVNRFNVMLPKRAPQLVYTLMSGPCDAHRGRAIAVCVGAVPGGALGHAPIIVRGGDVRRAMIVFADSTPPDLDSACHELFHTMGWFQHGSWVDVQPCPYDDGLMRKLYKRDKRHR